jgi:hypothetical protein
MALAGWPTPLAAATQGRFLMLIVPQAELHPQTMIEFLEALYSHRLVRHKDKCWIILQHGHNEYGTMAFYLQETDDELCGEPRSQES